MTKSVLPRDTLNVTFVVDKGCGKSLKRPQGTKKECEEFNHKTKKEEREQCVVIKTKARGNWEVDLPKVCWRSICNRIKYQPVKTC